MAETKTRTPNGRAKTAKPKTAKTGKPGTTRSSAQGSSSRATKSQRSASRTRQRKPASKNGVAHAESARKAIEGTAKQAGHTVGDAGRSVGQAARKAKTPLLAGGAALAGVAGGIALGARQGGHSKTLSKAMPRKPLVKVPRKPLVKVDSRDLAKAAKEVGEFGMHLGQLASELRRTREDASGAKRRSPIEVVLQGLTTRKGSN